MFCLWKNLRALSEIISHHMRHTDKLENVGILLCVCYPQRNNKERIKGCRMRDIC